MTTQAKQDQDQLAGLRAQVDRLEAELTLTRRALCGLAEGLLAISSTESVAAKYPALGVLLSEHRAEARAAKPVQRKHINVGLTTNSSFDVMTNETIARVAAGLPPQRPPRGRSAAVVGRPRVQPPPGVAADGVDGTVAA